MTEGLHAFDQFRDRVLTVEEGGECGSRSGRTIADVVFRNLVGNAFERRLEFSSSAAACFQASPSANSSSWSPFG